MVSGHPQFLALWRKGRGWREGKEKRKWREGRGTLPDFYLD